MNPPARGFLIAGFGHTIVSYGLSPHASGNAQYDIKMFLSSRLLMYVCVLFQLLEADVLGVCLFKCCFGTRFDIQIMHGF